MGEIMQLNFNTDNMIRDNEISLYNRNFYMNKNQNEFDMRRLLIVTDEYSNTSEIFFGFLNAE